MRSNPTVPEPSARNPRLLDDVRGMFLPMFAQAFASALVRFDDVLFDRADTAGSSQMLYLDGMRELRRRRDEIAARLRAQLERAWRALEDGRPLSAEALLAGQGSGCETLRLVSEHELESRLAVRNLAGAVLRDCKAVLARLDRRLGWIAGNLALDADTDPIGPEHIGVAIHAAFATSDFAPEIRLVLVKLCERDLAEPLARFYQAVDEMLAKAGVIPQMLAPPRSPRRPPPCDDNPSERDGQRSAGSGEGIEGDQTTPIWLARLANRGARGRGRVQAAQGDRAAAQPASEDYAGGGGEQGAVLDALHELLQQARGMRESATLAASVASVAAAQQRPLSQREMLSVLSLLQATPSSALGAGAGEQADSLAQRLKSEVLSGATRLGVDPVSARLDPMDEDAIDLIGMLFDVLLDERDLEGRSRELISRLIVPFVKVAMIDRKMFVQKSHPARRLLDSLAEACEGNTGDSPAERMLMTKAEEVIERLVAEFNENLAIFLTLEDEFREFLAQHRRRVEIAERRAAETQRGQEKLDMARARAQLELEKRLNSALPSAVAEFLQRPWRHNLIMSILRDGEDGAAMSEALAVGDGVLDELAEARRHVVDRIWLQAWNAPLQKVFGSVGLHGDAALLAISALQDTLQAIAKDCPELERPLPELPSVVLPQPVPETAAVDLADETEVEDYDSVDAERFRDMPIGSWLDFVDKDGKVQCGKLSWVSPISARLLFVNRRGVRFCVASPEELAAMVRLGRLRPHASDGAFDTAMQGVLDRLDPQVDAVH